MSEEREELAKDLAVSHIGLQGELLKHTQRLTALEQIVAFLAADERVGGLLANGAGHPGVAPSVAERCTWRKTDESLMQ